MRKGLLLLGSISWFLLMFAGLAVSANAQTTALNEWTWVGGSHSIPQLGNYGTLGVAAAVNLPGSRQSSSTWVDMNGNLWLFGGLGYYSIAGPQFLNDLWEYTPSTGFWTWQGGPLFGNQSGAYGTQGVPSASSIPGGRSGAAQWTDANGNFWLFGGLGYDAAGNAGYLNDLWEYNVTTSGVAVSFIFSEFDGEIAGSLMCQSDCVRSIARSFRVRWWLSDSKFRADDGQTGGRR